MDDSAGRAVPEDGGARGRHSVANVRAGGIQGKESKRGHDAFDRLVIFERADAGSPPPQFERLFKYSSHLALAACLFGFAWAVGSYFSGGPPPFNILKPPLAQTIAPQISAEQSAMLHTAQLMAEDIRSLKANVEAVRAAQIQAAKDAAALPGLKARLDAVKTETGASIAALVDKVEHMQRDPEAKLSKILDHLDRIERQNVTSPGAAGPATARAPATAASGKPQRVAEVKPIEPLSTQRERHLIRSWVVRDVYDGVALVESPRGSIEVTPGQTIPGAGTVKAIERQGDGWIVITNRGVVDSNPD